MPGLIDAHWHAFMPATPQILLMTADSSYLHLLAARQAEATRFLFEVPRPLAGPLSHSEVAGVAAIVDSPDEVRPRAREQLRQGASQIKLMAVMASTRPTIRLIDPVHRSGYSCCG
jgi:imidazolonepropionase-like amidohydrolase